MAHVTDPALHIVFCEGRPSSLDDLLLAHLLPIGRVQIKPLGGKHGMRAYIEGYLDTYSVDAQPSYLGFRDRDFDVEPPDHPQLIRLHGQKPIWLSHRTAIENYLIDADLIRQYWVERENAPGWAHGPALSTDEIEDHITESARELADYQAVRWALAKLKLGARWPEVSTTWTAGSGTIPPSPEYDHCLAQASQLVLSFQQEIQGIHPDHLQTHAETYRERFADHHFFERARYLIWFHGKDHLVLLCRRLSPNFPRRHYADWAAEHVDIQKHPDLQQLVTLARHTS
jgi:hypothetical protein